MSASAPAAAAPSASSSASLDTKDVEAKIALAELRVGFAKEIEVGECKVLVGQTKSGYFAVGAKCSHYGAPLQTGALCDDRVTCPWHGACFNVKTGDIEEAPGLNALPVYPVRVEGDSLVVRAAQTEPNKKSSRLQPMAKPDPNDKRTFVIVGGGPAGLVCAETLRMENFTGRIIMISADASLPYDRPMLSKASQRAATEPAKLLLRPSEFFATAGIDVRLQTTCTSIDSKARTLTLSSAANKAETVAFDAVLLATGVRPRPPPQAASALPKHIFTVRSMSDAADLFKWVDDERCAHAVIVGAGFIGLELCTWLSKQEMTSITVITNDAVPFGKAFGPRIGAMLRKEQEEKAKAKFIVGAVAKYEGKDRVEAVVLASGERLVADVVIVGIGSICNTEFIKSDPAIKMGGDGSVIVDANLRSSVANVFAAGDIATFPCKWLGGRPLRVEHYDVAHQTGRIAARNMLGKAVAYESVPYFWTMQFLSVRFCGSVMDGIDEIIYDGVVEDKKFVAFFVKNGVVTAVASMQRDPAVSVAAELFRTKRMPTVAQLKAGPVSLPSLLTA